MERWLIEEGITLSTYSGWITYSTSRCGKRHSNENVQIEDAYDSGSRKTIERGYLFLLIFSDSKNL